MKRFDSFDKDVREKIKDDIHTQARQEGRRREWHLGGNVNGFGLCDTCKHFSRVASEFRVKLSRCETYEIFLVDNDPVSTCSGYINKLQPSLNWMIEIAYYIELKEVAGFKGKIKE